VARPQTGAPYLCLEAEPQVAANPSVAEALELSMYPVSYELGGASNTRRGLGSLVTSASGCICRAARKQGKPHVCSMGCRKAGIGRH
jgi:hypothetical protein